jgi:UDPglucose 6-dehydrogenase
MKITVFGNDLVGLVTAASLAEVGNEVLCVPLGSFESKECTELLINDEPGLSKLVEAQIKQGRFHYEVSWGKAVAEVSCIFIALSSKHLDIADEIIYFIAQHIKSDVIIVNQSTSVMGEAERFSLIIRDVLARRKARYDICMVAMPAFLSEGRAIKDFTQPDRILLGSSQKKATDFLKLLMRPFKLKEHQFIIMTAKAAEYSKFAVNALLATRMSLINEMANVAEDFEIDFEQVKQALGTDSRIGFNYINPGSGVGGPNFASDVEKLVNLLVTEGKDVQLLQKVLANNENQKEVLFRKVWRYFESNLEGKTFTIWGLSFKPETSTVENSSSIKTIEALVSQGANVIVYDPKAINSFKQIWGVRGNVDYATDMYDALKKSDGLLLMTEWKQFESPDFGKIKKIMNVPVIFDGRNVYDPSWVISQGFDYYGVGRGMKI